MEGETLMGDSVEDGAVVALLAGVPVVEDKVVAANVDTENEAVEVDDTRPDEPEGSPACRGWRSTRAAGAGRRSTRISPLRAICASVDRSASPHPLPAANAVVVAQSSDRKTRIECTIVIGVGIVLRRHASLRLGRRLPGRGRVRCDGGEAGGRSWEDMASDERWMDLRDSSVSIMVVVAFVEGRTWSGGVQHPPSS